MSEKIKISNNVYIPMPMTILGAQVKGRDNFMAVAWITRINANPPMIAMGIGSHHHTLRGVLEHKEFSVNIPGEKILKQTDYVGVVSGEKTDKSAVFEVFNGVLSYAPLIKECELNLACTVVDSIKLPSNTLVIGEIKEAYCNSEWVKLNMVAYDEMKAFFLTMPDNNYWSFGQKLGKAWGIGKELRSK
jgi:flavin reductase (DIM6/NTAB) family NADH-FMN oxidoreductase RutF